MYTSVRPDTRENQARVAETSEARRPSHIQEPPRDLFRPRIMEYPTTLKYAVLVDLALVSTAPLKDILCARAHGKRGTRRRQGEEKQTA